MDWFISDTHYHHKNIIRGLSEWPEGKGTRDFPDFKSHDDYIVGLINDHVMDQDTLYHLGDWSFGGKEFVLEFRRRLNCRRIHLLLGNHDHHILPLHEEYHGTLWESVSHYKELKVGQRNLVLMHYPIQSWNHMDRGAIHLHGHVHGNIAKMDGRYDVGVDAIGLISEEHVAHLKVAGEKRHGREVGGNKFGTK